MAVLLTIEGQYSTPSTIVGKKDLVDFDLEIAYPLKIEEDDTYAKREAMAYLYNFFISPTLKKKYKAKFKSLHGAQITVVEDMDEDAISAALDSGDLVYIEPNNLTASDVNAMQDKDIYWTLILMDGDNTAEVARTKAIWKGFSLQDKKSALKKMLGLKDATAEIVNKDIKRKSALSKAAKKKGSKNLERSVSETPVKRKRPTRKATSEQSIPSVTVSD